MIDKSVEKSARVTVNSKCVLCQDFTSELAGRRLLSDSSVFVGARRRPNYRATFIWRPIWEGKVPACSSFTFFGGRFSEKYACC